MPGAHPRIKLFDTFGASVQALRAGDVDVVLSDPTGAAATMSRSAKVFKIVGAPLPGEDYGFILRKGLAAEGPDRRRARRHGRRRHAGAAGQALAARRVGRVA